MRRLIAMVVALALILCGCVRPQSQPTVVTTVPEIAVPEITVPVPTTIPWEETELKSSSLGSVKLLNYVEEEIRTELSQSLDPEIYRVDEVSVKYISKEYLEELEYNSQVNIFFGYTLAEVEAMFEGDPFVFTLGNDGQTTVERFVANDNTFDRIIRGVAIGAGILLVCVTVVVIAKNPQIVAEIGTKIQMMFTTGSKIGQGGTPRLLGAFISGAATAIPGAFMADSPEEALKSIFLKGSEKFIGEVVCGIIKQ